MRVEDEFLEDDLDEVVEDAGASLEESDIDFNEEEYRKHIYSISAKKRGKDLSAEELNALIKRAQADDQYAWEIIFKLHEPFITYMKGKTKPLIFGTVTEEDFESYIYEGFVKAVNTFDETKGVKFITFAVTCVKNQVGRLSLRNSRRYYQEDVLVHAEMSPERVISIDANQGSPKGDGEGRALAEVIADTEDEVDNATEQNIEFAKKIRPLIRGKMAKEYFEAIASGQKIALKVLGDKYKISRAAVGDYIMKERRRLQKLVEASNFVHTALKEGRSYSEIAGSLKTTVDKVKYYHKIYNYLYRGAPLPIAYEGVDFQDKWFLARYLPFAESELSRKYFEACVENEYMTVYKYSAEIDSSIDKKKALRSIEAEKLGMRAFIKKIISAKDYSMRKVHDQSIVGVFGSTSMYRYYLECYDYFFESEDESEIAERGRILYLAGERLKGETDKAKREKKEKPQVVQEPETYNGKFFISLQKFRPCCADSRVYAYFPLLYKNLTEGVSLADLARKFPSLKTNMLSQTKTILIQQVRETTKNIEDIELMLDLNKGKIEELAIGLQLPVPEVIEKTVIEWGKERGLSKEEAVAYITLKDYFKSGAELPKFFKEREQTMREKIKGTWVEQIESVMEAESFAGNNEGSQSVELQEDMQNNPKELLQKTEDTPKVKKKQTRKETTLQKQASENVVIIEEQQPKEEKTIAEKQVEEPEQESKTEIQAEASKEDNKRAKSGGRSKGKRNNVSTKTDELRSLIELVLPFFEGKTSRASLFNNYVYQYYIKGLNYEQISDLNAVTTSTASQLVASGVANIQVNNLIAICCHRAENNRVETQKLCDELGITELEFNGYCRLYEFLYQGEAKPQIKSLVLLDQRAKKRNGLINLYGEDVLSCLKDEVRIALEKKSGANFGPVMEVHSEAHIETDHIEVGGDKTTTVKERAETPKIIVEENAKIENAPKKRGRKPKQAVEESVPSEEVRIDIPQESKIQKKRGRKPKQVEVEEVKAEEVKADIPKEPIAPKKRGRKPKQQAEVVGQTQLDNIAQTQNKHQNIRNEYVSFARDIFIERLTEMYKYNIPLKALSKAIKGEQELIDYCQGFAIVESWQIKELLNRAELEVLELLASVKKAELSRKEDAKDGQEKYFCELHKYLTSGSCMPRINVAEQLKIISILENDLNCIYDFSRYKGFLLSGKTIAGYAKELGLTATPMQRSIVLSGEFIEKEALMAQQLFETKTLGKENGLNCAKLSESDISRYLALYEKIYMGKPAKDFMWEEKMSLYSKLLSVMESQDFECCIEYIQNKKTISQIAGKHTQSVLDIKKKILNEMEVLDKKIEEIKAIKQGSLKELSGVKNKYMQELYGYLFEGGEEPIAPPSDEKIMKMLEPVLEFDSNFKFLIAVNALREAGLVAEERIERLSKEYGLTYSSAMNKSSRVKRIYDEFLSNVEFVHNAIKSGQNTVEELANSLDETPERIEKFAKVYEYIYNGGELVELESMTRNKRKGRHKDSDSLIAEAGEIENNKQQKPKDEGDKGMVVDKKVVLTKIAKLFPYDLGIEALKAEVVDGIPYATTLAKYGYSGNCEESIKEKSVQKVKGFLDKVMTIGKREGNPKGYGERAKKYGEKERMVSFYDKTFKYLFGQNEEIGFDNELEEIRLITLLYDSIHILRTFYATYLYRTESLTCAEVGRITNTLDASVLTEISKNRKILTEVVEQAVSTKKQVMENSDLLSVAEANDCTVWEINERLAFYDKVFFGETEISTKEQNKELLTKIGNVLTDDQRKIIVQSLVEGRDIRSLSQEYDLQERAIRARIKNALIKLNAERDMSIRCKRLASDNAKRIAFATQNGLSQKKFDYYLYLYNYLFEGGKKPIDTLLATEKDKFRALKPYFKNNENFMLVYKNVVDGVTINDLVSEYDRGEMWYTKKKRIVVPEVEQVCEMAEKCYELAYLKGLGADEVAKELGISPKQVELNMLIFIAVHITKKEVAISEEDISQIIPGKVSVMTKRGRKPKSIEEKSEKISTPKQVSQPSRTIQKVKSNDRESCRERLKKFMLQRTKKMTNIRNYFMGEDIDSIAKKMALNKYASIDHILRTCQQCATESRMRGVAEVPTAYEIFYSIVPFDENLYQEPLQEQLVVMKVLPWGALTKLLRAVETTIKKLPQDKIQYLKDKYCSVNDKGVSEWDFAEMLNGEDEFVVGLYPEIQKEFTAILDRARQTWQQ